MLAALSFASVLAISLASYVAISYTTLERVDDKVTAASELLEAQNVLEETLYEVSNEDLSDWSLDGDNATQTVTGVDVSTLADSLPIDFTETVTTADLGDGETIDSDSVELKLSGLNSGSDTRTLSLTQKTLLDDGTVQTRVLSATMEPIAPFQAAIATDRSISLRGNGTIDSYDSSQGAYGRNNRGYEAALVGNYVGVSRADVSGYASASGRNPYFGRRASLKGPDTGRRISVDTTRIIPTPYLPNLDTSAVSGVGSIYGGPGSTLGNRSGTEPRIYYARDINLSDRQRIVVQGPTQLVVAGNINLSDDSSIVVNRGASLEVHVEGNVYLDGKGIINLSQVPANVAIIGTNSDYRTITFRGDQPLHAAIYAPNSHFSVDGRNDVRNIYGAVVADRVTFHHETNFHFDVALREAHFDGVEKAYAFESNP